MRKPPAHDAELTALTGSTIFSSEESFGMATTLAFGRRERTARR